MTSMIGNIYVEIFNVSQETQIWVFLLPVIDMILSSFMLYLQFDFTKTIYASICGKFDIFFIEFCGDLLDKDVDKNLAKEQVLSTTTQTTAAGVNGVPGHIPKMEQQPSVQSISYKTNRTSSVFAKPPTPFTVEPNLTLDMAEIENSFRPPSPSPSPIAERDGKDENVRKKPMMPRRPPRPKLSHSVSGGSVRPITPKS